MIRDGTHLLSYKDGHWRHGLFNINAVSLKLFDTLGQKFVVVNQRPQIPGDRGEEQECERTVGKRRALSDRDENRTAIVCCERLAQSMGSCRTWPPTRIGWASTIVCETHQPKRPRDFRILFLPWLARTLQDTAATCPCDWQWWITTTPLKNGISPCKLFPGNSALQAKTMSESTYLHQ